MYRFSMGCIIKVQLNRLHKMEFKMHHIVAYSKLICISVDNILTHEHILVFHYANTAI